MKKENVVKNVLVKSLVGFTVGVTLLMISYASIYFIAGESVFQNEIKQLQNIETLINQIIITGIAYYLLFIILHIISILENKELNGKYMLKHPYKYVLTISLVMLVLTWIIVYMVSQPKIYSENIGAVNLIILVIASALVGLGICIKITIENHLIKEINKKLKEKN